LPNNRFLRSNPTLFAFLKRHFFFALAGFAFVAMALFVLLKETGIVGNSASADKGKAATSTGKNDKKGGDKKSGAGARPTIVTLAKADVRIFSDRVEVPGTAMANESIVVTSKVQDVVEQVLFESGQYVQRGAPLIILSKTEQSADVGGAQRDVAAAFDDADGVLDEAAAARADADAAYNEINAVSRDLEAARASISEARLNRDRVKILSDRGYASKARLDGALAQLQTADARVLVARERAAGASQRITTQEKRASALTSRAQSVEQRAGSARSRAQAVSQRAASVQSRLSDRTIRAPFSGRLGLRTDKSRSVG
jgi:multidrug efflux pump subunit AcrA (membrane-fusion protein)